ncbi:MAG TPA: DUF983 domain-containing protein, partial [Acidimicrobiia bacterium]|nr:DUF983 domain-containing protein [Acidimicrobiia bacterium]
RTSRAFLLRCPNCGGRGVVRGLGVQPTCPSCGHYFERHEGYWIGAVAVNTVATIGVFAMVLVGVTVLTWPDVPWGWLTVVGVLVTLLFPIGFYPWSKLLWAALDLTLHPIETSAAPDVIPQDVETDRPDLEQPGVKGL